MFDWMDDFLTNKNRREKQHDDDMALLGLAKSATPLMFNRLGQRLIEDTKRFTTATRKQLDVGFRPLFPNGPEFVCGRDNRLPHVLLRLEKDFDNNPIIHGTLSTKSFDSQEEMKQFDIHIIARGQDQIFYRLNGRECSEGEISKNVLGPLLELI